jgi:hypothetical protein
VERFADNPSAEPDATTVLKSVSASKLNLLNRAKRQLEKVEAAAEPDLKKAWPEYEKLRRYIRQFKQAGFSPWPVTAVAGCCAVGLIVLAARNTRNTHYYHHPQNYLRVIQNLDPCLPDGSCGYRFVLQNVKDGVAYDPTEMHFCKSLQPRFEAGHSLAWIRYTNLGSCISIDGFDVVRDSARNPILAGNCKPDYASAKDAGHINCEGGKAKF